MSDSETTGWDNWSAARYRKTIGKQQYECIRACKGHWYVVVGSCLVAYARPTLRECQLLAHATARLWAGETE